MLINLHLFLRFFDQFLIKKSIFLSEPLWNWLVLVSLTALFRFYFKLKHRNLLASRHQTWDFEICNFFFPHLNVCRKTTFARIVLDVRYLFCNNSSDIYWSAGKHCRYILILICWIFLYLTFWFNDILFFNLFVNNSSSEFT